MTRSDAPRIWTTFAGCSRNTRPTAIGFFPKSCGWRIVISHKIPQDSPSCYDSVMRDLVVLFIHFIATLARLLGPGGARSILAVSLLLKHQLLIVNRPRHRSPKGAALLDFSIPWE